jgi:hypothetical protein
LVYQGFNGISSRVLLGLQHHSKVRPRTTALLVSCCSLTQSRKEVLAPWHPDSRFSQLKGEIETLKETLNRDLHLTDRNTKYYIRAQGAARSCYVQLHSVLALCNMALLRDYIAYLPWDQPKPAGPVDGPSLPAPPPGQETWWEDNARSCFATTKEFMDLAWRCCEHEVLVETPIVGFAMFYVMQIGKKVRQPPVLPIADTSSHLVQILSRPGRRQYPMHRWIP